MLPSESSQNVNDINNVFMGQRTWNIVEIKLLDIVNNKCKFVHHVGKCGNCLFESLVLALYNERQQHSMIREIMCMYLEKNKSMIEKDIIGVANNVQGYIDHIRKLNEYAGGIEIKVLHNIYEIDIEIFDDAFDKPICQLKCNTNDEIKQARTLCFCCCSV